jgi:hypothetical protein
MNSILVFALWVYNGEQEKPMWDSKRMVVRGRPLITFAKEHIKDHIEVEVVFGEIPPHTRAFVIEEPFSRDGFLIISSSKKHIEKAWRKMLKDERWNGEKWMPLIEWAEADTERGNELEAAEKAREMRRKETSKEHKMSRA